MLRARTKIGDVFSVPLDVSTKKYFQYVANDLTQLNSDVIRAFSKAHPIDSKFNLPEIVADEVDFHAHVVIKWGIKMRLWEKVGNVPFVSNVDVLFRGTEDHGNKFIRISNNWYVWRINEEFQDVGRLTGAYRKAEIGMVMAPTGIVHRLRTGEYPITYPGYE
jgi:hypothetical protein